MEILKTRLLELRNALNLNQMDFGEKVGLSKASISALESGLRNITDRHIMLLCSTFNVSETWIRTGKGEMFVQPATFSLDAYAQKNQLTELELDIIKSYMDLNKDVRQTILATAQQLFAKHSEIAATIEDDDIEAEIDEEIELYRQELRAEKKARMLSVSPKHETG